MRHEVNERRPSVPRHPAAERRALIIAAATELFYEHEALAAVAEAYAAFADRRPALMIQRSPRRAYAARGPDNRHRAGRGFRVSSGISRE